MTDVAVVGAGPTGLAMAVRLAQLGVAHVVVDANAGATRESRATLVHAATLEILDELDVADELIAAGRRVNRIGFSDRGRVIARIGLTGVPSRYRFALGVPQSTTEQLLVGRLAALGGMVRREYRAEQVTPAPDGYLVTGAGPAGGGTTQFEIRARYVAGCDGAHSVVRSSAGLEFRGETYPQQFVLADAKLRAAPGPDDEAQIFTSPLGVVVTGRLPSGNHRIVATVDADAEVPDPPGGAFIDAILRERGVGQLAADPVWSSRFRVAHRVAARFRADGVFLCGPAALEVVTFTDRMTTMATLRSPAARALRDAALAAASRIPPVRDLITLWVTGLKRSPLRHDLPPLTPARLPATGHA